MKIVNKIEDAVNAATLPAGIRHLYRRQWNHAGDAAEPAGGRSCTIRDVVPSGSTAARRDLEALFSDAACERIEHRVIFNGPRSRKAVNTGLASYQLLHLSDIPHQVRHYIKPNVVFLSLAGPDNGGNFSYGTSVEACRAAGRISQSFRGVLVIAERNANICPFVLGTTIAEDQIDFLVDTDYPLPASPVP